MSSRRHGRNALKLRLRHSSSSRRRRRSYSIGSLYSYRMSLKPKLSVRSKRRELSIVLS